VKLLYKIILVLVMLAPAKIFACAACYGGNIDDSMADGMNWAILTLGTVVATVLGAFLAYFIYIMRKSEKLEAAAQQKSSQNLSKLRSNRNDKAQAQENLEPAFAGSYKIGINSPEPAKI
jgi:hypothetical protein